ncbi:hypothetical protein IK110_03170 [Candidatus Saccharibacteria bacterium]|nr:hypothetical protein [Candidatus Saccharibacteria bacterium]
MDDGERRSDLFDAEDSAMEEVTPDFSTDAEPDTYNDGGSSYNPMWGNVINSNNNNDNGRKGQKLYGGKSEKVKDNGDKKKRAANALSGAEKSASKNPNDSGRGGDANASLKEKEDNTPADSEVEKFKNAVQGVKEIQEGKASGTTKLKKAGPVWAIIALLFGFGGLSFFGQMSMPFSLISQLQEEFDSISVSQTWRTKSFLRVQLDNGNIKDCRKYHLFSSTEFKVSDSMKTKLAKQGITFDTDSNGVEVMRYKGKTIVADPDYAGNGRVAFEDAFDNDVEFSTAYSKGARTWRGAVGAWFDSSMDKLLNKLGVKRGVWRNYKNGTDTEANSKYVRETIATEADADGSTTARGHTNEPAEGESYTDQQTGEKTKSSDTDTKHGADQDFSFGRTDAEADANGKITKSDGVKSKLSGVGEVVTKISSVAAGAVNLYCGVMDFIAAVNAIVAAYQAVQIINTAAAVFEGIQKAQAGDGDAAPLHELALSLTTPTTNTYEKVTKVDGDGNAAGSDSVVRSRSAMEADSISALYGRTMVNANDPSVSSFNISTVTSRILNSIGANPSITGIIGNLSTSASAFASCSAARLAAAAVGMTTDIIAIVGCIASWGIGCAVDAIYEGVGQAALSAALGIAISAAVSFLVPHVAKVLTREIATKVMGEDLGNAIVSGANMYMGHNHQYSGGAVASKNSLLGYLQMQDTVIAENARYERATHSPFDITSKYTFMGSLASQLVPLASQSSSLSGIINSAGTIFGNAVQSLTPRSSAVSTGIEVEKRYQATKDNCPDLASIGGVGDAFCNAYIITDMATINQHPADTIDGISDEDIEVVTENGKNKPKIKDDSKLAKYLIYCGQRQSPWGIADQNVLSDLTLGSTKNQYGDAIVGAIPVVGDFTDILGNSQKLANMGWITGQSCVADPDDDVSFVNQVAEKFADSEFTPAITWKEGKQYQRFIEDQRLAEAMYGEKSAVTEYLAEYYEKHPLDNSFEGVLARYSGLTKEQVAYTFDMIDLGSFLAEYEPASLYPYAQAETDDEHPVDVIEDDRVEPLFAIVYNNQIIIPRKEAFVA